MKKRIEFGELRLGEIARKNLNHCIDTSWATYGPKCKEFETKWGQLFNYSYNKAVSSGTDACMNICFSLYDFGANRGDEIIAPALSFVATSNAILAAGFTPVFVDIDRRTLNINPELIEAKITPKTRAIQVVHTMGRPCDMVTITNLARQYNLKILEDCCEAHGAKYNNCYVGRFGHAAAFSFYTAHLICCGEGGMVSTMHKDVADVINSTRSHGRRDGELYFDFPRLGLNSKMNDLEASLGLEAVECFWNTFARRHSTYCVLFGALEPYKDLAYFSEQDPGCMNCPHGFSITVKNKKHFAELTTWLDEKSIHWKRNFGSIPTQHAGFAFLGHKLGDFPDAEYVGDFGLHFGIHQHLSDADVQYMVDSLVEFFESR